MTRITWSDGQFTVLHIGGLLWHIWRAWREMKYMPWQIRGVAVYHGFTVY